MSKKLIISSFLNASGIAVYVIAVSFIIRNGEAIFGKMDNFLGPVAFLLLFVLSAAITATLMFGKPVILYFENRKAEAVRVFFYTVTWLFILTLAALATQILL